MRDYSKENIEKLRKLKQRAEEDLRACENALFKQQNRIAGIDMAIKALAEPAERAQENAG